MDEGFDNIGAAITGGLAARAVEPEAGEGRAGAHETECANCSVPLVGPHCHFCGQQAHVHRTLTAIFHDLVHGVLHLDGKFWRTLPLLIFRPGELTRRYAHGERAKFVSPLGMFLFTVFFVFLALTVYGVSLSNVSLEDTTALDPEAALVELDDRIEASENRIAELQVLRSTAETGELPAIEEELAGQRDGLSELREGREAVENINESGVGSSFTLVGENVTTGWDRLDKGLHKFNENPSLGLYKLQSNFYKFSWLLIPISVPFVWLLFFWTRRFRMYDHTVFVTYSLSFMSLLAITLTVLGFAGLHWGFILAAALIIPPLHIFAQLKGAYRSHWVAALIRTIILLQFCLIVPGLFFTLLLGIGALG